jgi:hypothetical protein
MIKTGPAMRRMFLAVLILLVSIPLIGCSGGTSSAPPQIVTQILSDPALDGDIMQDPLATDIFTVTQGMTPSVQSVFAGIDPGTGEEFRTFLNFPLTGPSGVPGNAVIVSATLDIVINSILLNPLTNALPIRIDLVSFQPPTLIGTDYSRTLQPALATTTIVPPISQADSGHHVYVDVTSLMNEAQRLGLTDLQIRLLEDPGMAPPGLIEINDTTGAYRRALAPLLQVSYF